MTRRPTPPTGRNASRPGGRVRLRRYSPDDFEVLYQIDQVCYEPEIAYSRRELSNYLRFPGADCVVAESAGQTPAPKIIGFCITAHERHWGYIVTMDVLAPWRRQGIGSMLLAEAERRLASAGVREVSLETAIDNATAIAFWQKHGYRKRAIRKNYYPGGPASPATAGKPAVGRDAFSMIKLLA